MKMKKAQGMSMNVIVIAAIALLVLVVLIAIFSGKMGEWSGSLDKQTEGGKCAELTGAQVVTGACPTDKDQIYGVFSDVGPGQSCCGPKK